MSRSQRFGPALLAAWSSLALGGAGCQGKSSTPAPSPSASVAADPLELDPELAAKVLAKVGDRQITLGDYASALARMDQFERLRYQTPERRRQLLQELINAELLAAEARRRGLAELPETQERVRQLLRDELQRDLRVKLMRPGELPEAEVRSYYEAHKADFADPERRRVAVIVLEDEAKASRVLAEARAGGAVEWGQLVRAHSVDQAPNPTATAPLELAGDLGIVSPPGEPRGSNPRVPEGVRAAVFTLAKVGDVAEQLVQDGKRYYVVKLTGLTEARTRSYAEAERSLRVTLAQQQLEAAEQKYEQELRQRYPVKIDSERLSEVRLPAMDHVAPAASR